MKAPRTTEGGQSLEQARAAVGERRRARAWEAGFLNRVLAMSLGMAGFVLCFLLALGRTREAASYAIGAGLSVGLFQVMRFSVTSVFTRSDLGSRKKWLSGGLTVGKYGAAGLLIYWLTRWPHAHLPAFAAGATTVQAVLFLKALGRALAGDRPPAHWKKPTRPAHGARTEEPT